MAPMVVLVLMLFAGAILTHHLLLSGAGTPPTQTTLEARVTVLLNRQRHEHGLSALKTDSRLIQAARAHTVDMIDGDYFSHDEPSGRTYAKRMGPLLRSPGVSRLEENIEWATGHPTASELVSNWMHSPEHRANILNPNVHRVGQGISYSPGRYQGNAHATVATSEFSN